MARISLNHIRVIRGSFSRDEWKIPQLGIGKLYEHGTTASTIIWKIFAPFSAVAALGFPTPVSLVSAAQSRGAQTPGVPLTAGNLLGVVAPSPALSSGATNSGAR